jgi:hypothetical protein
VINSSVAVSSSETATSSVFVNSSVEGVCFVVSLVDIIGGNVVVEVVVGGVVVEVVVGRVVIGVGQITFRGQSHTL